MDAFLGIGKMHWSDDKHEISWDISQNVSWRESRKEQSRKHIRFPVAMERLTPERSEVLATAGHALRHGAAEFRGNLASSRLVECCNLQLQVLRSVQQLSGCRCGSRSCWPSRPGSFATGQALGPDECPSSSSSSSTPSSSCSEAPEVEDLWGEKDFVFGAVMFQHDLDVKHSLHPFPMVW
jgi:hypothetical protein